MRFSIRAVLIFGIIGVQIVTVSAILISSYATTQDALLQHARQLMLELSVETIWRSEQFLEPARGAADLTQRLANNEVLQTRDFGAMERYFFEQLRLYPWFSGLYFGANDGSFVFVRRDDQRRDQAGGFETKIISMQPSGRRVELVKRNKDFLDQGRSLDPKDQYDPRVRPWFKLATREKKLAWTDPYIFFTSQLPGITATSPVNDGSGKMAGAVGVDIEIARISTFLRNLKIGKSGSALIVNRNSDVIAYPDSERIKQSKTDPSEGLRFVKLGELNDPVATAAFASLMEPIETVSLEGPAFTKFTHDGVDYLAVFTPFFNNSWPWVMGIYVPEDDYLGVIKENVVFNLYIAVAVTLLACVVSILIWRTIARPLRQLSREANAIRAGNFDIQSSARSVYREIDETADAFRRMVTGLREHNRENVRLRDLQSKLIDSVRRSSLGQFASAVSHELNQPLAAIATYLQIIGRGLKAPDEDHTERINEAVEKAHDQADRAGAILQGLREMTESGETQRSLEDVNQVVQEAAALGLADASATGIVVHEHLADDLPQVLINRVQIQQVILNLIRNGVEAMSQSDTRVLTISTAPLGGDLIEVSVGDTGEGVPEEIAGRLFDALVTSKPDGMGVGLSISRSIIESHGGTLAAGEPPEGGMTFCFTLPIATDLEHQDVA